MEYANGSHASLAEEQCILAMESLLVEAEATVECHGDEWRKQMAYSRKRYDGACDRAEKAEAERDELREQIHEARVAMCRALPGGGIEKDLAVAVDQFVERSKLQSFLTCARCVAESAEATLAEQAKEIERLRSFVERCAEGEHPDEIPEEALALALPDKLERLNDILDDKIAERLKAADAAKGCVKGGPSDLSCNKKYLEDFGK